MRTPLVLLLVASCAAPGADLSGATDALPAGMDAPPGDAAPGDAPGPGDSWAAGDGPARGDAASPDAFADAANATAGDSGDAPSGDVGAGDDSGQPADAAGPDAGADTGADSGKDAGADAAPTDADASPPEPPIWTPPEPGGCNGWLALCDRAYDEVAYATTHNAMSNEDAGWFFPNQHHGVAWQLEDGVRALMLDVHADKGDVYLCHGTCLAGSQLLVDGLAEVRAFLDAHPREVVTIIFESYVPAADIEERFAQSGLLAHVHAQEAGAPWPTLGELVDAGGRLVVFTDHDGHSLPWYMDVWDHAFETHFHYESVQELSCDPNRGDPDNPLFILNHFLTAPVAFPELAEQVNHNPLLWDRALGCQAEAGHLPNFVTVDFYDIGDVLAVVDALNQVP